MIPPYVEGYEIEQTAHNSAMYTFIVAFMINLFLLVVVPGFGLKRFIIGSALVLVSSLLVAFRYLYHNHPNEAVRPYRLDRLTILRGVMIPLLVWFIIRPDMVWWAVILWFVVSISTVTFIRFRWMKGPRYRRFRT